MLIFTSRPADTERTDFEAKVQGHVEELDKLADEGPDYDAIGDYIESHQAWKSGVKESFFDHQDRKCAYCERSLTDWGDVEHFRPKKAIYRIKSKGAERPNSNKVKGRTYFTPDDGSNKPGVYDSGYWWLAYAWDNYLLACGICNQSWKNALFPVRNGHRRRPRPGDEAQKEPYVLDPYGGKEPGDHLEFTSVGGIRERGGSRYGKETIEVLGLDRPSVVASRLEKADRITRKLRQFAAAGTDLSKQRPILEDIALAGDAKYVHAGMVRVMYTQYTQKSWSDLETWLAEN